MEIDIIYLPDGSVNVVAPKNSAASFEAAAAKMQAFAEALSVELGLPVSVVAPPERHLHGPDGQHVGVQHYQRQ